MRTPAAQARLVTPAGLTHRPPPRPRAAASVAIDLAAIAVTADDDLGTAGRTQEQTPRSGFDLLVMTGPTWTKALIGRIIALHACPARCGARRRDRTWQLRVAPCLPLSLAASRRHAEPGANRTPSAKHPTTRCRQNRPPMGRLWSGLPPLPPSAHHACSIALINPRRRNHALPDRRQHHRHIDRAFVLQRYRLSVRIVMGHRRAEVMQIASIGLAELAILL